MKASVRVKMPDGTTRDVPAHMEAANHPSRPSRMVPDRIPGFALEQTIEGTWIAFRERDDG